MSRRPTYVALPRSTFCLFAAACFAAGSALSIFVCNLILRSK